MSTPDLCIVCWPSEYYPRSMTLASPYGIKWSMCVLTDFLRSSERIYGSFFTSEVLKILVTLYDVYQGHWPNLLSDGFPCGLWGWRCSLGECSMPWLSDQDTVTTPIFLTIEQKTRWWKCHLTAVSSFVLYKDYMKLKDYRFDDNLTFDL